MMRWRWRKSIRLPLGGRLNLSRSGVGYSVGVPGYRMGVDARGRKYTQWSIRGTGIYNRVYAWPKPKLGRAIVLFIAILICLKACS